MLPWPGMSFRLAVVQFKISHLDRAKNLARIERFIARAKKAKAEVIVFPEDCTLGSIHGDLTKLDRAFHVRDTFVALAKKYAVDIVTGTCMEGRAKENLSTSYYVNKHGKILGSYHKNHLYPSERAFLSPGTEAPVFDTEFGKAAIVVCWDMLFPEIFERLKQQGVEIIYCPSYWSREIPDKAAKRDPLSEEKLLDALSLTRAVEINAILVYANAAGVIRYNNASRDTLIGHSQVVAPVVGALKRLRHNREQMFVQEVDLNLLEAGRTIYHG